MVFIVVTPCSLVVRLLGTFFTYLPNRRALTSQKAVISKSHVFKSLSPHKNSRPASNSADISSASQFYTMIMLTRLIMET
jgi:hypothetical protein